MQSIIPRIRLNIYFTYHHTFRCNNLCPIKKRLYIYFSLISYDLTVNYIKTKITIDALWNELIIQKYKAQLSINANEIRKDILMNGKVQSKEYQLSEIIFEVENKEEIEKKYKEIKA